MIRELLHAYGASRRRDFAHDRLSTLGSSGQGRCLRQTAFSLLSVPPDEGWVDTWGAAIRGTVYEDHCWVPALRQSLPEGCELLFAGEDQVTMVDEDARLSATPDGLIVGLPRDCLAEFGIPDCAEPDLPDDIPNSILVECKTVDPRMLLRRPKPEHEFQVQMAMGLVRRCTDYAPEYAVISYTNASFWDQVTEFPVKYSERVYPPGRNAPPRCLPPAILVRCRQKASSAGGQECQYCGWAKQCGEGEVSRVPAGGMRLSPDAVVELKGLRDVERKMAGAIEDNASMRMLGAGSHQAVPARPPGARPQRRRLVGDVEHGQRPGHAKQGRRAEAGIDLSPYEQEGNASERLIVT